LKGDQAGVCGTISPVGHEKQQLELFFKLDSTAETLASSDFSSSV
jgi:hypothetical protein